MFGMPIDQMRVSEIERKADEAVRKLQELDSLRLAMDSVERTLRELSTETTRLCDELYEVQHKIVDLTSQLEEK